MDKKEVIIVGGGLAGLTAAIHLSKVGMKVKLFEKNDFPRHKVCGEYISNEVLPYFDFLEVNISSLNPARIARTLISTISGKQIETALPLGGFGVSRYALDNLLFQTAVKNGCEIIRETVNNIAFEDGLFSVTSATQTMAADVLIGAFGKRSNIDQSLGRSFVSKKSDWLAVKAHYSGHFPNELVGLHNFKGGYCGVSNVEDNMINICYLADYDSFKKYKNIQEYQQNVLCKNPRLKTIFESCQMVFEKPITISQISFEDKKPVENHILMIGDTAGLIHPLCGNGMAMAVHSAKIVAELIVDYAAGKITSREKLETEYIGLWNHHFRKRLKMGRRLARILRSDLISSVVMKLLVTFPAMLPKIITRTHGQPLTART